MPKQQVALNAFNRGIISPLALARTDVKRAALSAETQTNWMPRVLGSMMLRPGTQYLTGTLSNNQAYYLPFIFSTSDTAILEMTVFALRPLINEAAVTFASVGTAISNGTFHTDLTGWTDADQSGATSQWVSDGVIYGYMSLIGTGFNAAIRKQTVTVAAADQGIEHAIVIDIGTGFSATKNPGKVRVRIGSTDGGDDYVAQRDLAVGEHILSFTPSGNFYIQFSNANAYAACVANVAVFNNGAAAALKISTPYNSADLSKIRWDQSADVIYLACDGYKPQQIMRWGTHSWSVCDYDADDGPFRVENIDNSISITPSAIFGDITLTASTSIFYSGHVGALFSLTSTGQVVNSLLAAENEFTDYIQITGIGAARAFAVAISGTWVATVTLQRSVGTPGAWVDVTSYTVNTSAVINDALDNQIIYYRIGVKSGDYTSGTANCHLTWDSGSITGIVRITGYTSSTSVTAAVLKNLGSVSATVNWAEGEWSSYRGFATADCLFEGRMWWAGRDNIWGSVSDDYISFDAATVGDAGPISRSIGSGPVDTINWILPLIRLMLGGQGGEHSCRSSAIDSPLTPTDFGIRQPSSHGSAAVPAVKVDMGGFFVNKSATRLFELTIENAVYSYDYQSVDRSLFCPELTAAGIVRIAVQRMPDTRIHCVLADGTVAILVYDPLEEVQAWMKYETDGQVVDAFVMPNPNATEDRVYYAVKRGLTYCLERWALESECVGGTLNKQLDCFILYSGAARSTFFILDEPLLDTPYRGQFTLHAWDNGVYVGAASYSGGTYTFPVALTNAVIGMSYTAQYKSSKLAYAAPMALGQEKQITHLGVIAQNMHYQALRYGKDFNTLRSLPAAERGKATPANTIWAQYDNVPFDFDGDYDPDSRLCLQVIAPLPCTLLAAIIGIATNEEQ